MKGISAVIATILLLLIVIAIVGFAFGFFQKIFTTTTQATETQTQTTLGQLAQVARIESAAGTALSVRNAGTGTLQTSTISVYVNGTTATCNWGATTSLAPNAVASCTLSISCSTGTVRIVTAGGEDSKPCI